MSVLLALVVTLIGCVIYSALRSIKRPTNYPPGPELLPWMGNTIQLRKESVASGGQHIVFEKWAQKYKSNIIGLKLGQELVVVALSYPHVRDVHLKEVFEGRPDNFFLRLRTMGTRMGITCTDGKLWYEHRHFAMKQMRHVGYGRTQMEKHIENEANRLLKHIDETNEAPVWPGSFLAPSVINVLWSLTAGKQFERTDERLSRLLNLINKRSKAFDVCGGMLSQFPWLRYFAPDKTGYNLVCQMNKELYNFFMETIIEHRVQLSPENEDSDLIFAYIKEMKERDGFKNNTFSEAQLTMTILDFFIAGSQTTSNTMDLALMMMALKPDIQDTIYKEISNNLGDKEFPHLKLRTSFPYMDAFIMEIQRYFHITPISGPRRTLWDTTLGGYSIPKNTTVLIGLRSVLMDEEYWIDPGCFRPERFLDKEGKTVKAEYFMPFGQGRRRCLGDTLARACLFSFLIEILQRFKLEFFPSTQNESTHLLVLQPGITLSPKPYKIKFVKNINP